MQERARQVTLTIEAGSATDAEEIDVLTFELRRRLLELDIEEAALVRSNKVPDGAKPADVLTVGALIVTLTPAMLKSVVALLNTWLEHRPVRGVILTVDGDSLELKKPSESDQHLLVQSFIDRHARQ